MWTLATYRLNSRAQHLIDALQDWLWTIGAQGTEVRDDDTFSELETSAFARQAAGHTEVIGYFPPEASPRTLDPPDDLRASLADWDFSPLDPDAWTEGWKQFFSPTQLSPRLLVHPSWERPDGVPAGVYALEIDPGMAFGTGTHETTTMCARIIDAHLASQPRVGLLDVGCGSGILAIGAAKLGAATLLGIDIDPIAVDVAKSNWHRNGLGPENSAPFATTPLGSVTEHFELVVANMLSGILLRLRGPLLQVVEPGGTLVVSGILADERAAFEGAFLEPGWAVIATHELGEWIALELACQ